MFDILPSLVIERIQDYLYPFTIPYLKLRLLNSDFKLLIDGVINDTYSQESINFRLWVILLHHGCKSNESNFYSWSSKSICLHCSIVESFQGTFIERWVCVRSLMGNQKLLFSLNHHENDNEPIDLAVCRGKIVLHFSNHKLTFNYPQKSVSFKRKPFSSRTIKTDLPSDYSFWFEHNGKILAKNKNDSKKLMMIDNNFKQKIIDLPFDSYLLIFDKFAPFPLMYKIMRQGFELFNPLDNRLKRYEFTRYSKFTFLGSNEDYDCFRRQFVIHLFSRNSNKTGTYRVEARKNIYYNVLSDRILYFNAWDTTKWNAILFSQFIWKTTNQ